MAVFVIGLTFNLKAQSAQDLCKKKCAVVYAEHCCWVGEFIECRGSWIKDSVLNEEN